ncbi:acetyl-CoA carboxylase biotin carboxyl carrier protein [Pseudonocardia sp. GCM10023141]|uniref:acetyl-CoA carboxylase biotin carboxyl carrier protein n=1 Tax=Pseudonocardia sp. GCM10023141 TaxID=3252653 RepID=UPI0036183388
MTTEPDTAIPDSVTHREVQEILRTFAASGWTAMTLEVRGMTITVGKQGPPAAAAPTSPPASVPAAPAPAPVAAPAPTAPVPTAPIDTTGLVEVRSPAVGAFWAAPGPGEPPFVAAGQLVARHDQLAIVEVMKLMNPVVASSAGEIAHVLVANAEMVEYDQVLFLIRPSDG